MMRVFLLAMVILLAACVPIKSNRWYDSGFRQGGFFERVAAISALRDSGKVVTVQRGDNYHLIAARHNISLRALIEVNNARPPYLLNVGDKVRLPQPRIYKVRRGDTLYAISRLYRVDVAQLARANSLRAPYTINVGQELNLPYRGASPIVATRTPPKSSPPRARTTRRVAAKTTPTSTRTSTRASTPRRSGRFLRPINGRIISDYGDKGGGLHNDGINIAAAKGAPIKATENGVVVYAGNELRGYGNLLLVRHADGWVSAYAHTSRFRVRQGERVKQGQVIADVGQSGNVTSPQLHFELRKGTRAVNPKSLI